MAATVTGTFVLLDRATAPLKRIEQQAERTDRALAMAGDRLDGIGTRQQMAQHEKLGRKLRETENNADLLNKRMDKTVGATDAVAAAMGRASAPAAGFGSAIGLLAAAAAALLPIVFDLGGALGALVGSLGRALKGAVALSVGGIGVLGTALAGLAGTVIPTISNLGKLSEAFNAVSEAQQKYGKGSKEAREAMKEMVQARKSMENFDVKRGMAVVTGFDSIKEDWNKMTAKGQSAVLQMMLDAMNTTKSVMPMLARNANEIAAATGKMMRVFFDRLNSAEFRRFVTTMTDVYEKVAVPIAKAFSNIGEALGNIAVAASDELERLAFVLEKATEGWADATSNVGKMRTEIAATSREMGDWYDLLVASWKWLVALFGPGANEGQGLVKAMTGKLNEQTQWFRQNTDVLRDFYEQSGDGVRNLARLLGDIAPTLYQISEAMRPVVDAFQTLINLLSEIEIGRVNALTLAITGFGVGQIGGLVKSLGQRFAPAALGAGAMPGMSSPMMASPGDTVFEQATQKFSPVQNVNVVAVSPQAAAMLGAGGGASSPSPLLFGSPGSRGNPNQYPYPIGPSPAPAGGGGGRFRRMVTAGGGFAAGVGAGMRQGAGNMFPTTRAVLGGLRSGGGGMGMMLGRGAMGAARFAGRAFLPLSALFAIGDFLSTEGNIGQKLQGALSGATLGIVPGPLSSEERKQRGVEAASEFVREEMEKNGKGMNGLTKTIASTSDRIAAVRMDLRAEETGRYFGIEQARTAFARGNMTRGALDSFVSMVQSGELSGDTTELRAMLEQLRADRKATTGARNAQSMSRADFAQRDLMSAFELAYGKRGDKAFGTFVDNALYELSRLEGQGVSALASANIAWLAEQKRKNPALKATYDELAKGVEDRFAQMGRRVRVINGRLITGTADEYERITQRLSTNLERERQRAEKLTRAQRDLAASLSQWRGRNGRLLGMDMATNIVEDVEGARNPQAAARRRLNRVMSRRARRQTAQAIEGTGYEGNQNNPVIQAMAGVTPQRFSPQTGAVKPIKMPKIEGAEFRKSLDAIKRVTSQANDEIKDKTDRKWGQTRKAIVSQMEKTRPELARHMARIREMTLGQLRDFGYSPSEAKEIFSFAGGTGNKDKKATGGRLRFAGGGRIGGTGRQDSVPITLGMAAPGELIVNRHTERDVDRDLRAAGKPPLGSRVAGESRKHSDPDPLYRVGGFNRGGRLGGTVFSGSYPSVTGDTDFSPALGTALSRMATATGTPIYVQSGGRTYAEQAYLYATKGPGMAAPPGSSKHETGMAADITPGREAFGAAAGKFGLAFTVPHESWHIELVGGGAGGAFAIPMAGPAPQVKLKAPRTKLRGVPGGFSQGASNVLTEGKERKVNRELKRRGGGGFAGVGPPGGGRVVGASVYGGGNDPTSGTQGYKGDSLPGTMSYAELGYDGSGNPASANLLGGLPYGAPLRITYGGKSVVANKRDIGAGGGAVQGQVRAIDLWHETASALGFPFGVDLVKVEQLARGGRLPAFGGWFGDGGSFTADRPTLIGVGERGPENVQISPVGRNGGRMGRDIKIGNINIQNHRKGDIRKQIKQEISQAFTELEQEVSSDTGEGVI